MLILFDKDCIEAKRLKNDPRIENRAEIYIEAILHLKLTSSEIIAPMIKIKNEYSNNIF